ncbi:MAG: cytochrome P450 [Actinobacteria bacterium]|nr:MAG: cytochrome P450 [Actinomycetota bacterium]
MAEAPDTIGLEPGAPEGLIFNPFDPVTRADPYAVYRRLREEDPVHRSPLGIWILSRYGDIEPILRDARFSNDIRNARSFPLATSSGPEFEQRIERRAKVMLFVDPPDHTRLRSLVNKAFTPRVVEQLRPRAQEIVDDLLDHAIERGEMDLIADLSYPLPVIVIAEMLGIPPEDRVLPPDMIDVVERSADAFTEYFERLIADRRARPGDDLLSALVAAEQAGDRLSPEELVSTCILILVAGHETTMNLIGNGMLALLRHPDELARLRADVSLVPSAVEELLRYDGTVQMTGRTAKEDVTVGGRRIEAGEISILLIGSANRDPERFADPERVDVTRKDIKHLAFGAGAHYCLGAPLARVEAQIAFTELLRRLPPSLCLATDQPEWRENIVLRGLKSLPLTW